MYIESLIVNCQGDPDKSGEDYPDFEQVLEEYYERQIDDIIYSPPDAFDWDENEPIEDENENYS